MVLYSSAGMDWNCVCHKREGVAGNGIGCSICCSWSNVMSVPCYASGCTRGTT